MFYNDLVVINRRVFCASAAALLAGCRPRRGSGFPGYVFVAVEEAQSLAAVDLTAFALVKHLPLGATPTQVLADQERVSVYALAAQAGSLHEVDARGLAVRRRLHTGQRLVSMRMAPAGNRLWVLSAEPRQLIGVSTERMQADRRIALPAAPEQIDLTADGKLAAVTHGAEGSVTFVDLARGRVLQTVAATGWAGPVRFRQDGRVALVGDPGRRTVCVLDALNPGVITELRVAVKPRFFCFKPDGGEMLVTGDGMDAVVIVNPYYYEVAETMLAGRAPGAMACSRSPQYLFVTNPPTGDVTILDPETRRVVAVVAVGAEPFYVTITPDSEYALILNRRSGTMAVIRPAAVVPRRTRGAPLYTTIPVGAKPIGAAVVAV